jgi:hypothetical protein
MEAGAHATDARRRGRARYARPLPGRARLDVARRRSRAASVLGRLGSLCRRAASGRRHRRTGRHRGARACVRCRLLRGLAPAGRPRRHDSDGGRVLGDAAAARRDVGRPWRDRGGALLRRSQRRERRPGERGLPRPPRRADHGRSGRVRRPARSAACSGAHTRPPAPCVSRLGSGGGPSVRCGSGCGCGSGSGAGGAGRRRVHVGAFAGSGRAGRRAGASSEPAGERAPERAEGRRYRPSAAGVEVGARARRSVRWRRRRAARACTRETPPSGPHGRFACEVPCPPRIDNRCTEPGVAGAASAGSVGGDRAGPRGSRSSHAPSGIDQAAGRAHVRAPVASALPRRRRWKHPAAECGGRGRTRAREHGLVGRRPARRGGSTGRGRTPDSPQACAYHQWR